MMHACMPVHFWLKGIMQWTVGVGLVIWSMVGMSWTLIFKSYKTMFPRTLCGQRMFSCRYLIKLLRPISQQMVQCLTCWSKMFFIQIISDVDVADSCDNSLINSFFLSRNHSKISKLPNQTFNKTQTLSIHNFNIDSDHLTELECRK